MFFQFLMKQFHPVFAAEEPDSEERLVADAELEPAQSLRAAGQGVAAALPEAFAP